MRRHDFPLLWCKGVCQVGDFFKVEVEPPKLLTREELNAKFNLHLDFLSFHRVKNCISGVINMNKETLFHVNVSDAALPTSEQLRLQLSMPLFPIAVPPLFGPPQGCLVSVGPAYMEA